MNNLFCPKCYSVLSISDWETDENNFFYRCKKECCSIGFRKSDNVCVHYIFDFEDARFSIYGTINYDESNMPATLLYDHFKKLVVVNIKHLIPIDVKETLPHQAERILKRLKGLIVFK